MSQRVTCAIAASVLALTGCVLLDAFGEEEPEFAFSHRLHVEDEGLDCSDCHLGLDASDEPGMPVEAQCLLCHEDIDSEKPPEKRIDQFFQDGVFQVAGVSAIEDEVIFSHLEHSQRDGQECSDCHGNVAQSDAVSQDALRVTMKDCLACHEQNAEAVSSDCATCHQEIDREWRPANHQLAWKKFHGPAAQDGMGRAGAGQPAESCSLCHSESSCNQCHAVEEPENHTEFWRRRGHSAIARLERDNCATCHQTSFCDRCHSEAQPINHRGTFGGTQSTHCFSCHFPLKGEGCITCHKGTPSHAMAAPKPPDHFPGMNCRQCHGVSVILPHVDKGDDCNICHQ